MCPPKGEVRVRSSSAAANPQLCIFYVVSLFEQQSEDEIGLKHLSIPRGIIADELMSQVSNKHQQKQIDRPMVNLQAKKKMAWVRDHQRRVLKDLVQVAAVLCDH